MTHPNPESVESVQPFGISPAPRNGIVGFVGFLTAAIGLITTIWMMFALNSINNGVWLGPNDAHSRVVLLSVMVVVEIAVAILALTSGIAAGAGKIWSRFGIMLYAVLAIVLAVVGILPVIMYLAGGASTDEAMRHAIIMMVVVKQWVVELPLAITILYTFSKKRIVRAYNTPVIESPDRSQR